MCNCNCEYAFNKLVQTSGAMCENYTGRNPLDLETEVALSGGLVEIDPPLTQKVVSLDLVKLVLTKFYAKISVK